MKLQNRTVKMVWTCMRIREDKKSRLHSLKEMERSCMEVTENKMVWTCVRMRE